MIAIYIEMPIEGEIEISNSKGLVYIINLINQCKEQEGERE